MSSSWTTIESDPGVFTELIEKFGVQGCQVEELYLLDDEVLEQMKPVYGLIFLFKWQQENDERKPETEDSPAIFARQVINNACATQAILSILLNCEEIEIGEKLEKFKNLCLELGDDYEARGLAIGDNDMLREVHNSFSRPEPVVLEEKPASKDDDAFHFISFVPVGNALYELDGLKAGPIRVGDVENNDWLSLAKETIEKRIAGYSGEIRFNLMALIRNRVDVYTEQLAELKSLSEAEGEDAYAEQIAELEASIAAEEAKFDGWKKENIRRKHNYIPFLINMCKTLAERGELEELVKGAEQKQKARNEARQAQKSSSG